MVYIHGRSSRNVGFRHSLIQGFTLSPELSSISLLLQFRLPLSVSSICLAATWPQSPTPHIHTPSPRRRENRLLCQQEALRFTLTGQAEVPCPSLAIPTGSGVITTITVEALIVLNYNLDFLTGFQQMVIRVQLSITPLPNMLSKWGSGF